MLKGAKLKNLHYAGHEKDQTEHQTGKENCPRAIQIQFHFFQAITARCRACAPKADPSALS
jgi:hypothetical protein